jgi:5-methylcytosine-specific restriction endonuclease McrA
MNRKNRRRIIKNKENYKNAASGVRDITEEYKNEYNFYKSSEWRKLRYKVLSKYRFRCLACGRNPSKNNVILHVDHIIPRSLRIDLSLDINNLQVLCEDCNLGKSNECIIDFRPKELIG